jgi:hypothetical protein
MTPAVKFFDKNKPPFEHVTFQARRSKKQPITQKQK